MGERNADFDVVLLDLGLPDSIGLETVVSAKRKAGTTPIVEEEIRKPVRTAELVKVIRRVAAPPRPESAPPRPRV